MNFLNEIKNHGKATALILNNHEKISYAKLLLDATSFQKHINKRSLVFILGGNNYQTIVSYISLLINNSVVMILDKNMDNIFFENLIKNYTPNYIISEKKLNINNYESIYSLKSCEIFRQIKFEKIKLHKDLAVLMTTSGSTGTQKLVRQSYQNYKTNTKNIIEALCINKQDSVITTLPISYTFGLSVINTHFYIGGKIILNEYSIIQKEFWEKYEYYAPSCFYGVPYTFDLVFKLKLQKLYHKKINFLACAGGRISDKTLDLALSFKEKNKVKFYSMYGQTEATARISILDSKYLLKKKGSIGKPIGNGKLKVMDKGKSVDKFGKSGNLFFEGKNVCLGYANSYKDLYKKDENIGRIDTGDIGEFDKDGFFFITGRKKRFIKFFGNTINLDEIEKMIEKIDQKVMCKINDDLIMIQYVDKKINKDVIKELLRKKMKINNNYIKFELVKKLNFSLSGKIIY